MAGRGRKASTKISIKWTASFAYALGLIATDGSLSKDGRHIDLTSKDIEQLRNFNHALRTEYYIGEKKSGSGKTSYRIQFSDRIFYDHLISLGVTPAKSKTLGRVKVEPRCFFDFLRGCFDGDGSFHSYYDPRSPTSLLWYVTFCSASPAFLFFIQEELWHRLGVRGHISIATGKSTRQLRYGKTEAFKILKNMYYSDSVICLSRKRDKIRDVV